MATSNTTPKPESQVDSSSSSADDLTAKRNSLGKPISLPTCSLDSSVTDEFIPFKASARFTPTEPQAFEKFTPTERQKAAPFTLALDTVGLEAALVREIEALDGKGKAKAKFALEQGRAEFIEALEGKGREKLALEQGKTEFTPFTVALEQGKAKLDQTKFTPAEAKAKLALEQQKTEFTPFTVALERKGIEKLDQTEFTPTELRKANTPTVALERQNANRSEFTPTVALEQQKGELALHKLTMLPSSQIQGVEEWDAKVIHLMDNELSELPESPNCPSLIALYLQKNYDLTIIPSLFFEHMPVLQVLDLSNTSIKSLPESLPKLVALRKLLLRGCLLFMELPPKVGELKNLEELDLDETQILHLPVEIRKLVKLKRLRVSFYGPMNCNKKRLQSNTVINTGVISSLSQLSELSIDVNPDDERWNEIVEAIIEEVCTSKMLDSLSLYLPRVELLTIHRMGSTSLMHHPLSRFSFVVGHHIRRIISRVPDEVEARFKEWDKCLKFVNGRGIPDEIREVLKNATAFYLERNGTAMNLSDYGIENMENLKFCILAECSEMQTIIDEGEFYEESSDKKEDDQSYFEFEYDSDSLEEVVLGSLLYLGIYYMNNLRSIWKGPIHECCLSNLKFLAIDTCPKLSTIFSVDLLANLINLEELIIDDCPQVTCLVSRKSSNPASVNYLPSLRKISLLFLPELVSISSGLHIAPELEMIGFYYCPKLENVLTTELSSANLKVIKGERKWWDEALKWSESDWGSRPDHLNDIFCEIDEEMDVMAQLTEQE